MCGILLRVFQVSGLGVFWRMNEQMLQANSHKVPEQHFSQDVMWISELKVDGK